jgi:hypothetical protein
MEFPVLHELPLPALCVKLVTQFLREPHPAAMLVQKLTFEHDEQEWDEDDDDERVHIKLTVKGPGLRQLNRSLWPPRYIVWLKRNANYPHPFYQSFVFDELTGESISGIPQCP